MNKLTKRQSEILDLIKSHTAETGFPPTRAEIAKTFGFRSANAAEEHLRALARKGAIEMTPEPQGVSEFQTANQKGFLLLARWLPVTRSLPRNI